MLSLYEGLKTELAAHSQPSFLTAHQLRDTPRKSEPPLCLSLSTCNCQASVEYVHGDVTLPHALYFFLDSPPR